MKKWQAEYSAGVTPRRNADRTWQFDFPQAPGHINYFMRNFPEGMMITPSLVSCTFSISASVPFISLDNSPGNPPSVRIMLRRDMGSEDGRWWSNDPQYVKLDRGTFTLSVAITDSWKNVNGKTSDERHNEFLSFLPQVNSVGLTFGGGSSYGHGIQIPKGKRCTFHLLSYKVT
jgi:hypothetical protein